MSNLFLTIPANAPDDRLDKALAQAAPESAGLSRTRISRLIAAGAVNGPDGPVQDGKQRAAAGQQYKITLGEAEPIETLAEEIPLSVVYEDDALIVIDKVAGMVVHPAPGAPRGTLVNALLAHCGDSLSGIGGERRPGIVHRLDKDTSGLLVVAKSDRAHHGLAAQFEAHTAQRRYLALIHGLIDPADPRLRGVPGVVFEEGAVLKIATRLARHVKDRQKQAIYFDKGRSAVTRARHLEKFGLPPSLSLVECRLETGRTHQIRVHMAHAGLGLIGDPVYGGNRRASIKSLGSAAQAVLDFPRQALHAAELGFTHPLTGEKLLFHSPLPADMESLMDLLRQRGP